MMQALPVNATASLADLIKAPEANLGNAAEPPRGASFSELVKEADSRLRTEDAAPSAQRKSHLESDDEPVAVQERDVSEEDGILSAVPQLAAYVESVSAVNDEADSAASVSVAVMQEIDFSDETVLPDIPLASLDLPADAEDFLAAVQEAAPEVILRAGQSAGMEAEPAAITAKEVAVQVRRHAPEENAPAGALQGKTESAAPVLAGTARQAETDRSSDAVPAAHDVKRGAKLTVVDQRQDFSSINKANANKAELSGGEQRAAVKDGLVLDIKHSGGSTAQLELSLGQSAAGAASQNMTASSDQAASAVGSQFQAMLANQIQANAPEFVRAGNIVLKDGNMGTINLIMHPESLGNVKITLEVSDKVIAGQITVASREAYNAFRESIGALQNAFTENGFESAGFNLSWSGSGQQNGGFGSGQDARDGFRMAEGERTYGNLLETEGVSELPASYSEAGDFAVNIVA